MRTYAEYLNTMTVKALNTIAREMGLKGYSKLRKAELIVVIDDAIAALVPTILDTEVVADHDAIAALIAEVATVVEPIAFSEAPESVAEALESQTPTASTPEADETSLDDLKAAYRNMRATVNRMGARGAEGARRIKYVGRLRSLSAQLKVAGIKHPQYL